MLTPKQRLVSLRYTGDPAGLANYNGTRTQRRRRKAAGILETGTNLLVHQS